MGMVDYIAIAAIVLIVCSAIFYIIREKKRGAKCVGCPHSKVCGSKGRCNSNNTKRDA